MKKIVIEPHYLGSLEYYIAILNAEEIQLEVEDHFIKQTYRNRCYFNSSLGVKRLVIPVKYNNRTKSKDVTIDYYQSWLRDHWGAFYSGYGKAPFYDFFADEFKMIWDSKPKYLYDLNWEMMTLCLKLLQTDRVIKFTSNYHSSIENGYLDLRNRILPKISFEERDFYLPFPYIQNFGNNFAPNLSIVDLLMSEGSGSTEVLMNSMKSSG